MVSPSVMLGGTDECYTLTAPKRAAGVIDVAVVNPGGQASRLERGFTYVVTAAAPTGVQISGNRALTARRVFHDGTPDRSSDVGDQRPVRAG